MPKYLRFDDLRERGIVGNRVTLGNWIRDHGFPAGILAGPNSRLWPEADVEQWLTTRPTAPKPIANREREPV